MGEDKPGGLVEAKQALFVLEDQVVGGYIIRNITLSLSFTIHDPTFLVDGEVAVVNL